jgi:hypothetical protein
VEVEAKEITAMPITVMEHQIKEIMVVLVMKVEAWLEAAEVEPEQLVLLEHLVPVVPVVQE